MSLAWNPWVLPGLFAASLALAAAGLVFFAGPSRRINRIAGLVLFVDAIHIATSGMVSITVITDPTSAYGVWILHTILDALQIPLYLAFVGIALDTPLARPFRNPRTLVAISAPIAAFMVFVLARPTDVVSRVYPVDHWYWNLWGETGWPVTAVFLAATLAFFYAFVAAVHAWRRAGSPLARRQGRAYVLAFGIRDLSWGTGFGLGFAAYVGLLDPLSLDRWAATFLFQTASLIAFPILFVYGVLKSQLFDIDLKIKWTLKQSTVAAIFLATFFILSEGTQAALENRTGSTAIAIGGAALLLLFLAPLQRLGDRVSDAALPHVKDTAEYRTVRKREVYKAALESALQDGVVTEKERDVLATLADQLDITAGEARTLEREAMATQGV